MTEPNTGAAPAVETAEATSQADPQPQTNPTPDQAKIPAPETDVRAPMQVVDGAGNPNNTDEAEPEEKGNGVVNLLDEVENDEEGEQNGQKTLGAPEAGYKFEPATETDLHLDDEAYATFGEVAKELNLSQEAAQKIINTMEPLLKRTVVKNAESWASASRQDPEFGGSAFKQNMKAIKRAIDATASPALQQVLVASGLINHPEVLRHFYGLSKTLGDGRFVTTQGASEGADGGDPRNFYKGMKNP